MHSQSDKKKEELKEALFEHALKRISVQAFDALLTCGVRDFTGFLHLKTEEMHQVGISPCITAELMGIQLELCEHTTKAVQGNNGIDKGCIINRVIQGEQQLASEDTGSSTLESLPATLIPNDLMERLSTRARNVLIREKILTCERLLQIHEEDLYSIAGIGRKTILDIKRLQDKVALCSTEFSQTSVEAATHAKPTNQKQLCRYPRGAFSLRCSDRHPSDPAGWSLLSRTFSELFGVTIPNFHILIGDDDEQATIGSLEISSVDINSLLEIVFFPEDPIYFLFSITTGYLLQASISDGALSVILEHLGQISGFAGRTQNFIASANVSNMVIYADIHTNLFEDFRVPRFPYPDLITKRKDRNATITWGDVAKITEYNVIERLGFTVKGLNAIKYLWQLKDQALLIENTILKGLPTEAFSEFDKLVNAFVQMVVKNEREYIVLKGRLGLLDGRKWTLEELGQREHLTRERIRQIEKKLLPKLGRPKALERLNYLWLAVDETLRIGGGVCCVAEIAESLRNCWKWQTLPSDEALASIISLSANYEVVWAAPIRFIMPNHKCVNCSEIGPVLTRAVESQPNGILSFDESIEIMQGFCQCQPCNGLSETHRFSRGFFHFLDDAIEEILADETNLYTQYAWGVKYGMRRTALVEQIIFNAGKAMHFKEVHAEANKDRPPHGQLSDRSIYGYLERSSALLLWGPGTFIHKELVTIPVSLISDIENDIILRFNTHNIPYLSITGLFEGYKNKLIAKSIPNAQALYSCIRITNHQRIDCPDYPYVLRQESGGQRLPIPLVLEAFVLEQAGVVTLDEIKRFAIEKLCVNEAVFMVSHLPNIPNFLRINRYEYIHLNQLAIEKETLSPIINHLIKLLEKYDHVSANLLYDQKKISCRLLGISTPMLLFSLVQLFYSDQFDLTRYPQIRTSVADNNRTAGVSSEVLNYIRDKALPCSFIELYLHFVDELGYEQYSVHNVLYTHKNLLRYSEGVIVYLETIGWTEEKQAALETLATNHLSHRKSTGKPYGLVSHLYDYMYDKLPELPDQISWTPTLIGGLLSSGGRYRILGTQRNAFVSVPNSYNIESLDDLLYYVLDTNYDGAANIEQFISDMRDAGILIKSITAIMLGSDSRVVIDGNVVKLAGLSNRVEGT